MESTRKTTLEMHTLLLCADVQFTGITRTVLNQLHVTPKIVGNCEAALALIEEHEFDVIIVDWRETENLADFLCAVRKSKLNQECVLVAIMRDLLDLRQAFAAGVHFLIHKPASAVQLPAAGQMLHTTGTVVWRTVNSCGVRLNYIPEDERSALEQWLTECVERSLAELCGRMRAACA